MLDAHRFEEMRACFTDDAIIDMEGVPPCNGPDAYLDFVRRTNSGSEPMNLHAGQNPRITPIGDDRATGYWDQLFVGVTKDADGSPKLMRLTGIYHDEYVRRAGQWLIAAMRFRQTSFVTMSPPGSAHISRTSGSTF